MVLLSQMACSFIKRTAVIRRSSRFTTDRTKYDFGYLSYDDSICKDATREEYAVWLKIHGDDNDDDESIQPKKPRVSFADNRQLILTQAYAVEHCPSAVLPASASSGALPAVPNRFVPSFAARLPKIEDYVEATLKDGTKSIQIFVSNNADAMAAGHKLAKCLFE